MTLKFKKLLASVTSLSLIVIGWGAGPLLSSAQTVPQIGSHLDIGSRGADVSNLQKFLATNPAVYPEGLVTGYFGPLTANAVAQFQIGYGLPAVGRVGPLTLQRINSVINSGGFIDVSAPLISNLAVSPSSTGASVNWITSENARGKVFYDTTPISSFETNVSKTELSVSGQSAVDSSYNTSKAISLSNLTSNTTYYYMVQVVDLAGNVSVSTVGTFKTQ